MKEIIVKDETIKLKKDYLTNGEVNYMVKTALEIYNAEGDIEGYGYSPLSMFTNFYALLFGMCIEDYNIDSIEDYDKYYNLGVHTELMMEITNAMEAYNLLVSISKQLCDIPNVIDRSIQKIINIMAEKIPNGEELSKMMEKMPKEWNKVLSEYNNIIGESKKEDE